MRVCVKRLQLYERRAPQLAAHWYRAALERDDAKHIIFLALQLRGNTEILALCRGIKDWGRRVHRSATTWQRKHAASKTGDCVYISMPRRPSIYSVTRDEGPQHGQKMGEVQRRRGCVWMLLYRIENENCFKRSEQ